MKDFYNREGEFEIELILTKNMLNFINESIKHYAKYRLNLNKSRLERYRSKKLEAEELKKLEEELENERKLLESIKKDGLESSLFHD